MRKLCERPGCGAPVDVSYGIDNAHLVVWIDRVDINEREITGKLCRRHAHSLSVPRGWTIDDRRVEVPELFVVRETTDESGDVRPAVKRTRGSGKTSAKRSKPAPPEQDTLFDSPTDDGFDAVDNRASDNAPDDENEPEPQDATVWTPRLTRVETSDEEKPVMGRLLGRAFGERPRSAMPSSFDPDEVDPQ